VSYNQEKAIFDGHSANDDCVVGENTDQVVLHIPSTENECENPTLFVCSSGGNQVGENKLVTTALDDLLLQVKESYANDPHALQRFSYYLVLKAKEISG